MRDASLAKMKSQQRGCGGSQLEEWGCTTVGGARVIVLIEGQKWTDEESRCGGKDP